MADASASAPQVSLYRKYRPAAFDELVGQPQVVQGLAAAVKTGRVAHAYLFSGPRGTGKTSVARILAKCLNCFTVGPRPDPCGICEACVAITDGTALDVVEIDGASNNGVEDVRQLRERVQFAPSQFRKKVYIIDEVHMLSTGAFNALLKTLEEPPEHAVFILATTELHKVPATIMSRCQRYEFRRMTPQVIAARLIEVAKREKIPLDDAAAQRIALLADGALRDALVLLDQARGFAGGRSIDAKALDEAFGESHRDLIDRLVDAIAASDAGAALNAVADATQQGVDAGWLAKQLLRWFRFALLARASREVLEMEAPADEIAGITQRADALGRAKIMTALRVLSDCVAQRWSTQPRIDLELALARIIMPSEELTLQSMSDRLRALEERTGGAGSPPPASAAPAAPPKARPPVSGTRKSAAPARAATGPDASPVSMSSGSAPLTPTRLAAMWHLVVSAVRERSTQVFAYLQHATIVDASGDDVRLSVTKKHFLESLSEPATSALIADAIEHVSGSRPRIAFVLGSEAETKTTAKTAGPSGFALAESVLGTDLL